VVVNDKSIVPELLITFYHVSWEGVKENAVAIKALLTREVGRRVLGLDFPQSPGGTRQPPREGTLGPQYSMREFRINPPSNLTEGVSVATERLMALGRIDGRNELR